VLQETPSLSASALSARMLEAARAFARGAPQGDDVTMVFVRRRAEG
jgi:serine phosphatase RsbU (regulator of sigma subunit)